MFDECYMNFIKGFDLTDDFKEHFFIIWNMWVFKQMFQPYIAMFDIMYSRIVYKEIYFAFIFDFSWL